MSSTNAESIIASGLTFNVADIDITAPKLNKSGGKASNILYKPTKKGLYINLEVPILTWGASMFKDPQSGKETYDMAIQFPRKDYSSPETDTLLASFQALEKHIKNEAVRNSMAWFNKKTMTPEVIEALWTPMLKYTKDQQTGEPDMTKAPTLKVKLPYWDGKFNCEIYDPAGTMLYPNEKTCASPMDLIPKGVNIVAIIQCGGLWFANGKFGCTWRLFQAVVQPKPSMKGRCLISISSATKNALTVATAAASSDETEMVIEDDSDGEQEAEAPAPKPAPAVPAPAVPTPTVPVVVAPKPAPTPAVPTPVAEPAEAPAVVKKKVIRKKD
jgi:hypothetical protein